MEQPSTPLRAAPGRTDGREIPVSDDLAAYLQDRVPRAIDRGASRSRFGVLVQGNGLSGKTRLLVELPPSPSPDEEGDR